MESAQLERLRRQYFALYPLHRLRLPSAQVLANNQDFLRRHILQDPCLAELQPEVGYKKTFWRRVVAALEEGVSQLLAENPNLELEVDEIFYELMAELMVADPQAGPSTTPGSSYRTFIYDRPDSGQARPEVSTEGRVTLVEEMVAIQAGTTGLRTWTAALHLAHHILHSASRLSLPSPPGAGPGELPPILELGAGTGFLSILLAQLGGDVVTTDLGDGDEPAGEAEALRRTPLARLQANVDLNNLARRPEVVELDWTHADLKTDERPQIWARLIDERRTIVAADIIYDPDLIPSIVSTLCTLLHPDPTSNSRAIIAATVRNEATLDLFTKTCRQRGLGVKLLDMPEVEDEEPTFWDSALEGRSEVRIFDIRRIHR